MNLNTSKQRVEGWRERGGKHPTHPSTHHVHALLPSSSRFNKKIGVGPPSTWIQISHLAETFFQPNCRQNVPHEKMGSAITSALQGFLLGYVGLMDCDIQLWVYNTLILEGEAY
jgi:hypothetical protein